MPRPPEARWRELPGTIPVVLDGVAVFVSLWLGYLLNFPDENPDTFLVRHGNLVLFSLATYLLLGGVFGAYRQAYTAPLVLQLIAGAKAYVLGTLVIFATLFLFRNTYYQQGVLLTFGLIVPMLYAAVRVLWSLMRSVMQREGWATTPCLAILLDGADEEQLDGLRGERGGFRLCGVIRNPVGLPNLSIIVHEAHRLSATCVLLVAASVERLGDLSLAAALVHRGLTVRMVSPEINETLLRTRLYDHTGIAYPDGAEARTFTSVLRAFDLVAGSILLLLMSPVMVAVAASILIDSGGPVFFRQRRTVSPQSRAIEVYKFRSMRHDAEEERELVRGNATGTDVLFKLKEDPRVTRVGRLIRKLSIDEIPQLFNVIAGDMSLVGPRPLPPEDYAMLTADDPLLRLCELRAGTLPGLTGLWQVSGRSSLGFREMLALDLYYIEHRSLMFNAELLVSTIPAVLTSKGAY